MVNFEPFIALAGTSRSSRGSDDDKKIHARCQYFARRGRNFLCNNELSPFGKYMKGQIM
jgi:hypothetical protein